MTWLFSFAARARSARAANDTTRAQINNIPSKSHVIPLLINLIEPGYSCGIHAFLNVYQLKSSKGNVQKVEFVVFDIKWKLFIQLRSGSLFGKSTRRGSIYRQSGFRHGCDARWNSLKYKWNLLTKFPQSLGASGVTGTIQRAIWVLFVILWYTNLQSFQTHPCGRRMTF